MSALGRFLITKNEADIASFKTPDVRNVLVTGPYFHDGSQETLWDVIDHYNKGDGLKNPYLDEDIQPLALTERDIDDLVAFLASLTSPDYKEQGLKELARQRALSRTSRPQRDTARAFGPKPPKPKPPRPWGEAAKEGPDRLKIGTGPCTVRSAMSRPRTSWPVVSGRSSPSGIASWMPREKGGEPRERRVGRRSDLALGGHCPGRLGALRWMMAWAEDRAPWRHDPSAVPGTKTEGGRHEAALSFPSGLVRERQIAIM